MLRDAITRRGMMISSAAAAGAALLLNGATAVASPAQSNGWGGTGAEGARPEHDENPLPPGEASKDYNPVVTPNGTTLPFKIVGGVKVFHLIAEEVDHEFAPGLSARCWGYNGQVHGPTIEAVEGDRVRIYVTNRLSAATTVHWHGVILPSGMDGVGGLSQRSIEPGETFKYEFTLRQHGTLMYHSHHDEMTQMAMGMMGMIVVHPRGVPPEKRPDRDFVLLSSEWKIVPGTYRPDPNEMTDFNILTFNAKCFPGTDPLVAKLGDKVRLRIGNLSAMDHHPIHLHGYYFTLAATDGGDIPESAQWPETTILVPVGSTRTVQFVADNPGDWAMHCHMTHHVMNQMGHGTPNLIGVKTEGYDEKVRSLLPDYMTMGQNGMGDMGDMGDMGMPVPQNSIPMVGARGPHDYITMGGMFTILKVRAGIKSYEDPGWYDAPRGSQADVASPDDLRRDGIDQNAKTTNAARPASGGVTSQHNHGAMTEHADHGNVPATAAALYACTMHPEIVSDKPGKCPKCGMKLVPKK
jgi:FtsP/CotA-like multicopper oxidase with cupredoxin domain